MGKTSNFATVPARLIVDGTDRGIQMFLVQLRDLETHQPLPGKGSLSVAVGKQKKKKMEKQTLTSTPQAPQIHDETNLKRTFPFQQCCSIETHVLDVNASANARRREWV